MDTNVLFLSIFTKYANFVHPYTTFMVHNIILLAIIVFGITLFFGRKQNHTFGGMICFTMLTTAAIAFLPYAFLFVILLILDLRKDIK